MQGKKSIIFLVVLTYPILFLGCDFKEQLIPIRLNKCAFYRLSITVSCLRKQASSTYKPIDSRFRGNDSWAQGLITIGIKKQLEKMVPKEADKFARDYIDILLKGDIQHAEKLLDPQVVTSETRSKLQEVANLLTKGELTSIEVVGVNVFTTKNKSRNSLTYQLQLKDAWLLVIVIVDDISGEQQIFAVNVKTIPKSLEEINAFTFSGKSFRHYIILLLAACIPVFIVYTIVLCIRTKMKRKWLWIIFMLFGVGKYSFNWTSGQMGFQPISFLIPGAAAFKGGPYAPWIISISVPIGALLFILKRRKIRKSESVDVSKALDSDEKVAEEIDS